MNDLLATVSTAFSLLSSFWVLMTSNLIFSIIIALLILPKLLKIFRKILG